MPGTRRNALTAHRRRMKRQGMVRLEVQVRKADAGLVRDLARALSDPERAAETRELLLTRVAARPTTDLKALLAAAPLEGIDLTRVRDAGRKVDL